MSKLSQKLCAVVLTLAMIVGLLFGCSANSFLAKAITANEEIVEFGSYPQSLVTNSKTISELNKQEISWKSYGYYSGDGNINSAEKGDWMKYSDVSLEGNKYRAVVFSEYRPIGSGDVSDIYSSSQNSNGYSSNNIYWFKFEPIKWNVLDSNSGLLFCEYIIDSQPFNYTFFYDGEGDMYDSAFGDKSYSAFANNYPASSIRKWLNDDFYNTAFNDEEKSKITKTVCENKGLNSERTLFDCESTEDYVFLLSKNEVCNSNYGFASNYSNWDEARRTQGTDYAKAQGLTVSDSNKFYNNSHWWLRTPGDGSSDACYIDEVGYGSDYFCDSSNKGVRPVIKVSDIKYSVSKSIDINYKDVIDLSSICNENLKGDYSYSSSDTAVVSVDEKGVITATGRGTAVITCTAIDNQVEKTPINITVNVKFTIFQWVIWILFLGFLWY